MVVGTPLPFIPMPSNLTSPTPVAAVNIDASREQRRARSRAEAKGLVRAMVPDIPAAVEHALTVLAELLDADRAYAAHVAGERLVVDAESRRTGTHTGENGSGGNDSGTTGVLGSFRLLEATNWVRSWVDHDTPSDIDLIRLGRRFPAVNDYVAATGIHRTLIVPAQWSSADGLIAVERRSATSFTSNDESLVQWFGDLIGAALHRFEIGRQQAHERAMNEALISNGVDPVIVLNAAGCISFASPAVSAFGWSPHHLVGKAISEFLHPDERRHHRRFLPEANESLSALSHRFRCSDDTWRWAETTVTSLFHVPDIGGAMCVIRDVTERQQTELELARAQSTERLLRKVSARFAMARGSISDLDHTIDSLIAETLVDVRSFFGADRAAVWLDLDGSGSLRTVYEARAVALESVVHSEFVMSSEVLRSAWDPTKKVLHLTAEDAGTPLFELINIPTAPPLEYLVLSLLPLGNERIGGLAVNSVRPGWAPAPRSDDVLQAIGEIIAAALTRNVAEAQLTHRAHHDSLTGLPNRVLLLDRIGVALRRATRTRETVGVLFVNIDRFKDVNDLLGHESGDQLLTLIGNRLRAVGRSDEAIARISGDEYVVLTSGAIGMEVESVSERILGALEAPFHIQGQDISVSASIGVAVVGPEEAGNVDPSTVIRRAEIAMHNAKAVGPAQQRAFDSAMEEKAVERIRIHRQLRHAVAHPDQFEVWFQPLVRLDTMSHGEPGVGGDGTVVGNEVTMWGCNRLHAIEALVRWNHPERGLLLPAHFIEIAEDSGLIAEIGSIVLDRSLAQLARWRRTKVVDDSVSVSVNVSVHQLRDQHFPKLVLDRLAAYDLPARNVDLEITESSFANLDQIGEVLDALHDSGVHLSVDDFGTGYSALQYLKNLPIDALKIDRSFVAGLAQPTDAALVRMILNLAFELGLSVVAEGVEESSQETTLRSLRCPVGQGWLYGRPAPADRLIAGITASSR
jgi:diguanylate cyclase (GGDEF)-like protein/PAS domain S-box-containing protein